MSRATPLCSRCGYAVSPPICMKCVLKAQLRFRREEGLSWIEQKKAESWRFRWALRWYGFVFWLEWWFVTWLFDRLVWDFNTFDQPRLKHARTGRFLEPDDPRHFED